jgi:hypothetical protein
MIMVQITDGGDSAEVPLIYYDEQGVRHVVGKAAVQIKNGEVIALGQITEKMQGDWPIDGMNLEGFSVGIGPFSAIPQSISPAEEASRRMGVLAQGLGSRQYVTDTNPNGEVEQCSRRDLHEPHEWQNEFGGYFNVYCPGNAGKRR